MSKVIKRLLESKYSLRLFEIVLLACTVVMLLVIWRVDVAIDVQHVPEIMSGLTSGTAILLGFAATCLTVMRRYYAKKFGTVILLLFYLTVPVSCLLMAYLDLVSGNFVVAVRMILTGFILSLVLVFIALFSVLEEVW